MIRQWSFNLILLLLVMTLVGLAFFQPGIEKKTSQALLTDFHADQINTLSVSRPTHKRVTLVRAQGRWLLSKPITARANDFVVSSVIAALQTASLKQLTYNSVQDSHKYGFDTPRAVVTVNDATVTFGDTNPLSQHRYVLYNGRVHMVGGNTLWLLTRNYDEYIDRRLLESTDSPIAIEFADGKKLELTNGSWVVKSAKNPSPSDSLTVLVNEWRYANALRVAPFVQGHTQGSITIYYKNKNLKKAKTIELDILSLKPELVLVRKDEGLQYHFPADSGKRLFLPK